MTGTPPPSDGAHTHLNSSEPNKDIPPSLSRSSTLQSLIPSDHKPSQISTGTSSSASPTFPRMVADASSSKQPIAKDHADVERLAGTTTSTDISHLEDPFGLRSGIVSPDALTGLRKRRGTGRKVAKFQRKQNNLIASLLKPMQDHTDEAQMEEEAARLPVKIAIYASLIANFCLCVLQLYAAISSFSLSLIATGIDSLFDLGSNILLFWLHRKAERLDSNRWPVGGARLETIGNIVYGFLMGSVNLVVIVESAQSLITHDGSDLKDFHLASIIAVAAALGVKLLLFLYCYSLRNKSSQVMVLWSDHRNDLYLNGFGILMSAGGSKLRWYLDPMGAVIIGLGVIISWGRTIYEQFELLAGKSAPHEFLQLLIYKAATFDSESIEKLDTVRAYHSGPDYFVEVDVVMNGDTPLWKAHDISERLQDCIEVLPNVERAFVHVDHEYTHTPEHRKGATS